MRARNMDAASSQDNMATESVATTRTQHGVASTLVVNKDNGTYSSSSRPRMRSGSLLGFAGFPAIANDVGARGKGDETNEKRSFRFESRQLRQERHVRRECGEGFSRRTR